MLRRRTFLINRLVESTETAAGHAAGGNAPHFLINRLVESTETPLCECLNRVTGFLINRLVESTETVLLDAGSQHVDAS